MHRSLQLNVLALSGAAFPIWAFTRIEDVKTQYLVAASAIVALLGFLVTTWLVPKVNTNGYLALMTTVVSLIVQRLCKWIWFSERMEEHGRGFPFLISGHQSHCCAVFLNDVITMPCIGGDQDTGQGHLREGSEQEGHSGWGRASS